MESEPAAGRRVETYAPWRERGPVAGDSKGEPSCVTLQLQTLLAGGAALAACAPTPVAVATASSTGACGTYGYVDVNNDGVISGDEWNTYRTSSYSFWDTNSDGQDQPQRIERCYRAGGFYRTTYYNPDYWTNYWSGFDANGDGYLSADKYWSTSAWARISTATPTAASTPMNGSGGRKAWVTAKSGGHPRARRRAGVARHVLIG